MLLLIGVSKKIPEGDESSSCLREPVIATHSDVNVQQTDELILQKSCIATRLLGLQRHSGQYMCDLRGTAPRCSLSLYPWLSSRLKINVHHVAVTAAGPLTPPRAPPLPPVTASAARTRSPVLPRSPAGVAWLPVGCLLRLLRVGRRLVGGATARPGISCGRRWARVHGAARAASHSVCCVCELGIQGLALTASVLGAGRACRGNNGGYHTSSSNVHLLPWNNMMLMGG